MAICSFLSLNGACASSITNTIFLDSRQDNNLFRAIFLLNLADIQARFLLNLARPFPDLFIILDVLGASLPYLDNRGGYPCLLGSHYQSSQVKPASLGS